MNRLLLFAFSSVIIVFTACAATPKKATPKRAPTKKVAAQVETAHRKTPYVGAIAFAEKEEKFRDSSGTQKKRKKWVVLSEDQADQEAYPASVTKLMTLLLVLEDIQAKRYGFDDDVVATADAYKSEPSWVGIKVGEKMTVRDLCLALMVESANDAAIVLGVHASGSLDAFVARMNARAKELGMNNTHYYNPNGLPPNSAKRYPWKSINVSTARDQAILASVIVSHPEALRFTSVKTCDLIKTASGFRVFVTRRVNEADQVTKLGENEHIVKQLRNHNNVMRVDKLKIKNEDGREAIDGLKTGYIDAGGSSVVLTGTTKGRRIIVVVLGSSSSKIRDAHAARIFHDAIGAIAW